MTKKNLKPQQAAPVQREINTAIPLPLRVVQG
jgi:prenylated cyclic peptide (anacyclamide/piricyclamide family)